MLLLDTVPCWLCYSMFMLLAVMLSRFSLDVVLINEMFSSSLIQIEFGDYRHPGESIATTLGRTVLPPEKNQDPSHLQLPHVVDKFYPSRYKDLSPQDWR